MVYLGTCSVCKNSTINEINHADCEVARLKDILYRAQADLKKGGKLSAKTQKTILSGSFTPLKKFLDDRWKERISKMKKETERIIRNVDLAHKLAAKSKLRFGSSPCMRGLQF